ncbi:phosphoadenosine phosphosulfate reductase family protein, partial [Methanothermococcus sp. SCGC AD-155-N22]|nr:phosphoadenosine phosphosulfate reductase family protein [Methanothermococcus sp. SCGC AD-155-N22]
SKHIKGQIQCAPKCAPILHWSAMHVWLYLFKNKAPYNKVYQLGFDRVGCYICPAMELGEIELIKRIPEELIEKYLPKK